MKAYQQANTDKPLDESGLLDIMYYVLGVYDTPPPSSLASSDNPDKLACVWPSYAYDSRRLEGFIIITTRESLLVTTNHGEIKRADEVIWF